MRIKRFGVGKNPLHLRLLLTRRVRIEIFSMLFLFFFRPKFVCHDLIID